ncbi:hypothetical protein HDU67_009016 [Dinochytrium kinnereticum]|nr:hypothetical protein HDU67_009016 [Dinochytrium kinnereticum]
MDAASMLQHQNRRSMNPVMAPSQPPLTLPSIAENGPLTLSSSVSSTNSSITATNATANPLSAGQNGFHPASYGGPSSSSAAAAIHQHSLSPARSIPSMRDIHNRTTRSLMPSSSLPSRGYVTGPPSRAHWKPDSASNNCDACKAKFGLLTRRHHCRACGGLYCGPCSPHVARLDQTAQPHTAGMLCRICTSCHSAFERKALEELEHSMNVANLHQEKMKQEEANGRGRAGGEGTGSVRSLSALKGDAAKAINIRKGPQKDGGDELPSTLSVPSDWSWSTF